MRRHVLNALAALAAVTALTVSGCSSSASKAAAGGAKGSADSSASGASGAASSSGGAATASSAATSASSASAASTSPSISAVCLQGLPGADKKVTHFAGGHNQTVEAYTTGDGPVGIVLAHQRGEDLCEWSGVWPAFPAQDYTVMSISMGTFVDEDVAKAVEQLRARGLKKIVLIGASMGGTAVLAAAGAVNPPVQGVVSLSGPARYGTADAVAAVKAFQVPVSYFAGGQDTEFASDAQQLFDSTAEKDKALKIFADTSDHGVDLWARVQGDVFAFIKKHTQ